jgi:hypothetical protein
MFELPCIFQKLSDSRNIFKVPRIRTLDRLLNLVGTYSNHWALKGFIKVWCFAMGDVEPFAPNRLRRRKQKTEP